ncbi:TETRASPANIN-19-LIKE [Salix koriyanagi]|uniref:TETRASPANIN-19-LIKE n=1 Tax=Salix koriyanagi TaxID=2511006 RepID=A0A9Q0W162_9ROSI|nr:TETRASPANIN-19-LIKE [Salix koriyanagi]
MARCARCCLRNSIKIVNLAMLLCGAGMIIYSLWLQKKWDESIAEFPRSSSPLKPWFIYTFLGVGIVVCLSTIGGYIITNCISNSTLCFYIVAICCLLFLEVAVIVAIFFKIDWGKISVVILAAILLAAGTEPRTHLQEADTSVLNQSFLMPAEPPGFAESPRQVCRRCGTVLSPRGENAPRGFFSRIKSLLRRRFQRTNTVY